MAAIMEKRARATFRDVLALHYIDGISKTGEEVNVWLKTHGGWFPDPQEVYGDGTPLTQPKDEGWDVMSNEPEKAMKEAKGVMGSLKEFFGDGVAEHIGRPDLKASVKKWLADLPRDRSRSPRRCVVPDMMIATMKDTISALDQIIRAKDEVIHKMKMDHMGEKTRLEVKNIENNTRITILEIQLSNANSVLEIYKTGVANMIR